MTPLHNAKGEPFVGRPQGPGTARVTPKDEEGAPKQYGATANGHKTLGGELTSRELVMPRGDVQVSG
jgi:hypothetical protein